MSRLGFRNYARWVLLGVLVVIQWGTFVRAIGAGAGCGDHWPLCNGELVPTDPVAETLIELTHRLTSGLALIAVVILWLSSRRQWPRGHLARRAAGWSTVFIFSEAAVGAALVLLEMVADNPAVARAGWMAAHLLNTFLLLAAVMLTTVWAEPKPVFRMRGRGPWVLAFGACVAALLLNGMSGAIAALGDTLFPAASLSAGLREDLSADAHVFVQLRLLHPFFAAGGFAVVAATSFAVVRRDAPSKSKGAAPSSMHGQSGGVGNPSPRIWATIAVSLYGVQVGVGLVNVLLLAPVYLQLVHLLVADLLWLSLIGCAASVFAQPGRIAVAQAASRSTSRG